MTPPIVKRYLIAFDKYKWIGLASFALVVAGSTVVAMQPDPAPSYVADGALTYNRPPVSFSTTGVEIQQQGQELNEEILRSNQIIEPVAAKVGVKPLTLSQNLVIDLPGAKSAGAKGGAATTDSGSKADSTLILLRYKDSDRRRAGETLQELMQAMIKLSSEINTRKLKAIIQKVNERLPDAKRELQVAERNLEQYDKKEGTLILAAQNGSLLSGITNSENQRRQIQYTISGIDAQIRSLRDKLGLSPNQAYVSSALSADPIIANARAQIYQIESQMEVFRKKGYRAEYPAMIDLQRQKEAFEQMLRQRGVEVVGGPNGTTPLPTTVAGIRNQSSLDPARQQLANQLVALQTQRETLQQQSVDLIKEETRLRQDYAQIPNKQLEHTRLEQQAGLKKVVHDRMQAKLIDAQTAEAETVSSLGVARPPIVLTDVKPPKNVPITLGVGALLGLLVGGGVIFLLGSLEGTFKTREDIRDSLKQREVANLGELPLMPLDGLGQYEIPVVLSAESPYLEFYEKFRSNLRRIGGRDLKVVLITSTSSFEGKTTSAYNLGVASARAGKRTLIIETDLRSPSHSSSLRVAADPDAAIDPLRYYASVSECIRLVPDVENLYIIPSPGPVRQSAAVLESSEMRRLLEDVRQRFDLVILDSNPLGLSNDALLIQPYSDGIVMVTRPNYTNENVLTEAIDQMVESELGLLGVVINGADIPVYQSPPVPSLAEEEFVRN